MSSLVSDSEPLNRVLEGGRLSTDALCDLFESAKADPSGLFRAAGALRSRGRRGGFVTFSKKAFFNLVNLCRDTCSYCTYKAEPGDAKLSMMSRRDVARMTDAAVGHRCVEALFVTGERPEDRYPEARRWLADNGFSGTVEYIAHCSEEALQAGMFPHTNAGNLSRSEMSLLKKTNVSLGLMLESSSERLARERDGPHFMAASKNPGARLAVLEDAGSLGIPMTTGVLLGIGETPRELVESIVAIRDVHDRHGNIQEVILQNFAPKQGTAMGGSPPADPAYFRIMVALARVAMPDANIQIPPNLSPGSYAGYIGAGINDWGGISPITPDFVNPEFAWPGIDDVRRNCRGAGFDLKCRFPVYPEFFHMVDGRLRDRMSEVADRDGYVREDRWR